MENSHRPGRSRRLFASAAIGASVVAIGLGAIAGPADATTAPANPTAGQKAATALPKVGPRKAPFSPRVATTRSATTGLTPANAADDPWIVGIVGDDPYGGTVPQCTGTIISPTKVLTAAGCQMQGSYGPLEVIAGRDNLSDDSVGFVDAVASTWVDPNYTVLGFNGGLGPNSGSNVQVLSLSQPLPSVYTPIPLSAQGDESPYAVGGQATTLGYGLNGDQSADRDQLLQTTVTTRDPSVCKADNSAYVAAEEVCESDDQSSLKTYGLADEGVPLVANGKQIGIGDALGRDLQTDLSFERLSAYHDLVTADLARSAPDNLDWNGDGVSDLFGLGYSGQTTEYAGTDAYPQPYQAFINQQKQTWPSNASTLLRVNNFGYDGKEGALWVDPNGNLAYQTQNADGSLNETINFIGSGWNQFTSIIPTNNFTGDGRPDLLAVRPDGTLRLYERTANGWVNGGGVQIGSGFNQFTHLTAFQWTNNGHVGVLGTTAGGSLVYYPTDGGGHWTNGNGQTIGVGFGELRAMMSTGSFGATDTGSIMTVTSDGILRVYLADGNGGWQTGNGIPIGVGFQTVKQLF